MDIRYVFEAIKRVSVPQGKGCCLKKVGWYCGFWTLCFLTQSAVFVKINGR